jgi:dienelactone hydrolase
MRTWNQSARAVPAQAVLDPQGIVGRAYGARTTPQMVLINPAGVIAYHGAIDSIRSANTADIPKATPFLRQSLEEVLAGKPVTIPSTTPYGCSVKYP